ncbi:hypothetical protein ACHAPT_011276 [Fusarium lateritium]
MPQPTNQVENLPRVVRLQVWHLDKQGQKKAANKELSEYLASTCLLRDWIATPATAKSSRDRYVPIEVDLTFRDTSHPDQESSAVSLRCLFDGPLVPQIQAFFKQQTTEPLQMNVFPVGELLTDETKAAFTHFHLFFSLALDGNISVANAVDVDRNILTETLRVAGSTLESYATLEDTAVDLTLMSADVLSGQSIGQVWRRLKKQSNTELGRQVAKHYGNGEDGTDNDAKKIKMCWQQTVDSLELFQSLATQVQLCVAKLTGSQRAAVSKEEVHLTLIQANLATAAFSEYQKHMLTVVEKLQGKYGKDVKSSRNLVGLAIAIILIAGTAAMTGGLGLSVGVCGAGGLLLGGDQGYELSKAYRKEQAVSQLDDTIGDLADALKDAKFGLASIYCSEVLQMPLQSMGTRERIEILTNLGIDLKEVGSVYQQELIDLRMGRFNDAYQKFRNEREAVKKDAELKEWAEVK